MPLQQLIKKWTEKDFKKFWEWTEKQLNQKPQEWWFVVDILNRTLKEKDKIRATHLKYQVYEKAQEFDKEHHLRRSWTPILMDEELTKESANSLNSLFNNIRQGSHKIATVDSSNKNLLSAILWGVIYLKQYCHDTSVEPIKLEELLDSLFLDFLLTVTPKTLEITPKLVPQETNLIDLAIWSPTSKGIAENQIIKRGDVTLEVEGNFGLPTVLTFEVAAVLQGIWQEQDYVDVFSTSLGEICKRLLILTNRENRRIVLNAIHQLHNTWFSAPFWIKDNKGKAKKIPMVYKINVVNIESQIIKAGRHHTLWLRFNQYLADNVRRGRFTLLDIQKIARLSSPTAKRLYSIIERQKNMLFQRKLSKLKNSLVLRGKRYKESIEKASQELVQIGFLEKYEIKKGKTTEELVFKSWRHKVPTNNISSIKGQ